MKCLLSGTYCGFRHVAGTSHVTLYFYARVTLKIKDKEYKEWHLRSFNTTSA